MEKHSELYHIILKVLNQKVNPTECVPPQYEADWTTTQTQLKVVHKSSMERCKLDTLVCIYNVKVGVLTSLSTAKPE